MKLSAEQLEQYREQGFVVVENLVNAKLREEIAANASRICAAAPYAENTEIVHWDMKIRRGEVKLAEKDRELGVFKLSRMNRDPWFYEYMTHAPELEIVEQIIGSGDLTSVASQLVMKPPRHGQWQPYHQDSYYFHVEPQEICGAWLAIDEATVANGCLWVIPGRHKGEVVDHVQPEGVANINPGFLEAVGMEKNKGIPVPMKPGSIVFFHSRLPHMSGPNTTDFRRRGLVIHYANSAWTWNGRNDPEFVLIKGRPHYDGLQCREAMAAR